MLIMRALHLARQRWLCSLMRMIVAIINGTDTANSHRESEPRIQVCSSSSLFESHSAESAIAQSHVFVKAADN
jgi:hypothetical protein